MGRADRENNTLDPLSRRGLPLFESGPYGHGWFCQLGPQRTILATISWGAEESDPLHLVVVLGHSCSS